MAQSLSALRRLRSDESGTSILEIALSAPLIVTFLIGIVDLAMFAGARMQVGQAVYRGLEIVQVNVTVQDEATIKAQVAAAAGNGVTTADVDVVPELYCDGEEDPTATDAAYYTTVCEDGEAIARYLKVSVNAEYTPFFPATTSLFFSEAVDGKVPFTANAAVRVQ